MNKSFTGYSFGHCNATIILTSIQRMIILNWAARLTLTAREMPALLSAIISCIRQRLTSSQVNVFDLEAVASLCLKNPLTFLHVHGFEEPPSIESIAVKVYVYTDTDANLVIPLCKQGVENSFICNTLQKCVLLQIDYIVSL